MATAAQRLLEDLITADDGRETTHNLLPATVTAIDRTAACVHRHVGADAQPDQTSPQETARSLRRRLTDQVVSVLKWAREQPLGLRTPLCGTPFELTESLIVSLVCSFALLTKEVSAAPLRCIPANAEPVVTKVGKLHGLELDWSDEREWTNEPDEARGGPKLRAWWRWATHLINVSRGVTLAVHPPAIRRAPEATATHQQVVDEAAVTTAAATEPADAAIQAPESAHHAAFQAPAPPPQEPGTPSGYAIEQQYGSPQAPSIPLPPVPFLQATSAVQPQQSVPGYGPQPPAYDPVAQAIMGGHEDHSKRQREGDGFDRHRHHNHHHNHRHEGPGRQRHYTNHGRQQ